MRELIRRCVFGNILAVILCGYCGEAFGTNGRPPDVTVSPDEAFVPMDTNVSFSGSASDPDGTPIQAWRWCSDNGVPPEGRSPEYTTSFAAKWLSTGRKTVTLYATDSDGSHGYGDDKTGCDSAVVYVVKADLCGAVADADEETVGVYLGLNNDDDDNDMIMDKDDPDITGDDDKTGISLTIKCFGLSEGSVKLEAVAGGNKIRIWTNENMTEQVQLPQTWAIGAYPSDLWVEGVETSAGMRDIALKLSYLKPGGGVVHSDIVKFTVFDVVLAKCPSDWMPKGGTEDNTVQMSVEVKPTGVTGILKAQLEEVSGEAGYCMNKPATVPPTGEDSAAWADLQFENPQMGFTISPGNMVATTNIDVSAAYINVNCYDYGAYGKMTGTATILNSSYPAHVENTLQTFVRIPRDDDDNTIADVWTHNSGNATDDADTSLNNTFDGDGLTRYEEYRGVDIDDDGIVSSSERLDPAKKDLFVQGQGFGGDFPDFAYGDAFANAGIEVHDFVGSVGTDDRNIDVLVVGLADSGSHIGRASGSPRHWGGSLLGLSGQGNSSEYAVGQSCTVYKRSINYYFSDKPYVDGNTQSGPGEWNDPPNGVLDWLDAVEDMNDDGNLDGNEDDGATSTPNDDADGLLDGDHAVPASPWDWGQDVSVHDIDNDGLVELPLYAQVPVSSSDEYSKAQVVKHTITHEMGHALGKLGHCQDDTCVMYMLSNNWKRENHLCTTCRATMRIHNN